MGELSPQRAPTRGVWRAAATAKATRVTDAPAREPAGPVERLLQLQRQAGNQAVLHLLGPGSRSAGGIGPAIVQRDSSGHRENPDVTDLHPAGTLTDPQWTAAYRAAGAKPSAAAYEPLFRDIAVTAGMSALPGFDLSTIPTTDGTTVKPGLNLTLATSGEPGHTGWVDKNGRFGVPLRPGKGAPSVSIAVILGPGALSAEKALSLRTVRHEMVHVRHKLQVLDAVRAWQAGGGRTGLDAWLKQQQSKKKMSALDVALVGSGAKDASANTEVLGYVEGFMTDFHRRPAPAAQAGPSFFELLGAVETTRLYTWAQADPAVQQEALTRLREYRATLDPDHQRLWKEWLDTGIASAANDKTGRKDFLGRLSAFVT